MSSLKPKVFVELGVYVGNSYNAFCQAVEMLQLDTQCYGIDTWRGDEHADFYDESVYNELFAYQQQEYQRFSSLLKMTFDEALSHFADSTIDLLHIDGFHTYEAVKHDFDNWLPKMSEKGIIILHDTAVKERDFGVWKLWEEISNNYPSFHFTHGYGLGIVVVGQQVSSEFIHFLEAAKIEPFYRELFHRLGHSILLLKKEEEDHQAIQQKDQHIQNLETILRQNDLPTAYFAQLFIDTGSGFSEEQSLIKTVTGEEQQLEFDLSAYRNIKQLRFDPINVMAIVQIAQITILDHEDHLHLVSNCRAVANFYQQINGIAFETNDPQIFIRDLRGITHLQKIMICLKYLVIGNEVYKILLQLERESK